MYGGRHGILILLLWFALFFNQVLAQNTFADYTRLESIIEKYFEFSNETSDYTQLHEDLINLLESPVNINASDRSELSRLFFLNEKQIGNIVEYRNRYGNINYPSELISIIDLKTISVRDIMMFIEIDNANYNLARLNTKSKKYQNEIVFRFNRILEQKKGYAEQIYKGNEWKYYLRYRYIKDDKIKIGLNAEKDPGEVFLKEYNRFGFDSYSGYIEYKPEKFIKKLIIGDYICQFGQGLTVWKGFNSGKSSSDVINLNKKRGGIKSYSSSSESAFFRGAAISIELNRIELNSFFSYKRIDARMDIISIDNAKEEVVKNIYESGYHRTDSEVSNKNKLPLLSSGLNLQYNNEICYVGASFFFQKYGNTLFLENITMANNYLWGINSSHSMGINYNIYLKKQSIFGELSANGYGGMAMISGIIFYPAPDLNYIILYRNYDRKYQNEMSSSFSEGSSCSNEQGIYFGIEYKPIRLLKLSAYYDIFSFPWLKHLSDSPSSGYEYVARMEFIFNEQFTYTANYKYEIKDKNSNINRPGLVKIGQKSTNWLRNKLNLEISLNSCKLKLSNKLDFTFYRNTQNILEKGWMFYQNISISLNKLPVQLSVRYALFNTDSYNTRIYTYENDLLYSFTFSSYHDNACRYYFILKYKTIKNLEFWIRYSSTNYINKNIIGSGLEEIKGNRVGELKFQLRLRF